MQDKKLWKMEYDFNQAFDNACKDIEIKRPTLAEVLDYGFNMVFYKDEFGYCEDDFKDSFLKEKVTFDYWNYDDDEYRIVYLKEVI